MTVDDLDLVPLQQRADAAGETSDDSVLPFERAGKVEGRPLDAETERRGRRLLARMMERIGDMDDRLRRNAADVQAGAAEAAFAPALLDQDDVEAQLAGAYGRDVAAGSATDDQHLGGNLCHLMPL
jgi:Iap family predicted aminopeptidase